MAELKLLNRTEEDLKWFNNNYDSIVEKFDNKFVAIKNKKIIAAEDNMEKMIHKLKSSKIDPSVTWVGFVSKIKTIL